MVAAAPSVESDAVRRRWLTFGSVVFAGAAYGGATTIANTVLPQMQGDLSVSLDQISWVITAGIVSGAVGTPPTPWLANRFGEKQLLIASLIAFTVSSTMIGFSATLGEVVLWRILQALTGAPIMALSQSFTINAFPDEQRGMAMAWWSIGLTCGWVFAPAVGAYLADQESWRMVFFIFAPIGILSIVLCSVFVPATSKDDKLEFDWFSFIALSTALMGLQVVLNRGQRLDWFESSQIVLWALIGALALYLFVVRSLTTRKPFINWGVFKDRNLCVGVLLTFTFAYISFTPLVLIPSMLEQLRGMEVQTIGFSIRPARARAARGVALRGQAHRPGRFALSDLVRISALCPVYVDDGELLPGDWRMERDVAAHSPGHRDVDHLATDLQHDVRDPGGEVSHRRGRARRFDL